MAKASLKLQIQGQVLMAHACDSSYLEGRDHKDHSSRPAWANSDRPHRKTPTQKRADGVAQTVRAPA
jgi:hypothetical protein